MQVSQMCFWVQGRAFEGWAEGPLGFPPTYKFRRGTSVYVGARPSFVSLARCRNTLFTTRFANCTFA